MRIAMEDLRLERLWVIYPGPTGYPMDEKIECVSLAQLQPIREALRNFGECLKPGGLLYVDTTSEANLNRSEPEQNVYPERVIDGRRVSLAEIIYTNRAEHRRTWVATLSVDGEKYESVRHSYYLPQDDLMRMMSDCGFKNFKKLKIRGEHYDVFGGQM